jgi:hypothetical protein
LPYPVAGTRVENAFVTSEWFLFPKLNLLR